MALPNLMTFLTAEELLTKTKSAASASATRLKWLSQVVGMLSALLASRIGLPRTNNVPCAAITKLESNHVSNWLTARTDSPK
jgi:hypothetical protein